MGTVSTSEQTSHKGRPERPYGIRRGAGDRLRRGDGVDEWPSTYNREYRPNRRQPPDAKPFSTPPRQYSARTPYARRS